MIEFLFRTAAGVVVTVTGEYEPPEHNYPLGPDLPEGFCIDEIVADGRSEEEIALTTEDYVAIERKGVELFHSQKQEFHDV